MQFIKTHMTKLLHIIKRFGLTALVVATLALSLFNTWQVYNLNGFANTTIQFFSKTNNGMSPFEMNVRQFVIKMAQEAEQAMNPTTP